MDWDRFNSQFEEMFEEKRERWAAIKAKRKAEGKCWQCANLIADCRCPNVNHPALSEGPRSPAVQCDDWPSCACGRGGTDNCFEGPRS